MARRDIFIITDKVSRRKRSGQAGFQTESRLELFMFDRQVEENPITTDEPGREAASAGYEDGGLAAWLAAVGGGPDAILDYIKIKLPQEADKQEAIARKCNCSSVWCPVCYRKFYLEKHFLRLSEIPWEEARFITLTLDRDKVGCGADAFEWYRKKKPIGRFLVNLKRQCFSIKDWCGQIEWHRDGTPHFHLLLRTEKGFKGMIGNSRLLKAWPWGVVREDYFTSEKNYQAVVGYFGKSGYFHKGKEHQTHLPDYFKSDYYRGKRVFRFLNARSASKRKSEERVTPKGVSGKKKPLMSTPLNRVEVCGRSTLIFYAKPDEMGFPASDYKFLTKITCPYSYFKVFFEGDYLSGLGYRFFLDGKYPDELRTVPF